MKTAALIIFSILSLSIAGYFGIMELLKGTGNFQCWSTVNSPVPYTMISFSSCTGEFKHHKFDELKEYDKQIRKEYKEEKLLGGLGS